MSDNYQEETQPLFKLLKNPAFRFVIVRYNHYSLVQRLEHDLQKRFPDRPSQIISLLNQSIDYPQLSQAYFNLHSGFLFIENFDDLFKEDKNSRGEETPDMAQNNQRRRHITAGLNLRRDKLAQYPIALFVFIPASTDSLYAKTIMEKMPDLWSFRSLMLDLVQTLATDAAEITNDRLLAGDNRPETRLETTLGGTDKKAELARLLDLLNATPETETAFRLTLYPQIADLQTELGLYQDALLTLKDWEQQANEADKANIKISAGDVYEDIGQLEAALGQFEQALVLSEHLGDSYGQSRSFERLGNIHEKLGNLDKALTLYEDAHRLDKRLFEENPSNETYKNGLAISYEKLGQRQL